MGRWAKLDAVNVRGFHWQDCGIGYRADRQRHGVGLLYQLGIKMERFVLTLHYGNGCSWSATEVIPIEYVNKECLWTDLNVAIKEAYKNKAVGWFKFANREFCVDWFMEPTDKGYILPEYPVEEHSIQTIDEWFFYYQ